MRESDIERYLVKRVEKAGGKAPKTQWINQRGAPDRLVLLPGYSCYVELKAPGGVLTKHQELAHIMLHLSHQRVCVLWNKKQVDEFMDNYYKHHAETT